MLAFKTIPITSEESELVRARVGCPPNETCGTYPCRHTRCLDPDYLGDLHDMIFNFKHFQNVWWLWHHREARDTIPDSERELYEAKFDRCQRINDKWPQIKRELD